MTWGHVEEFEGGIVRIFEDSHHYGDRYQYAFPFRKIGPRTVELVGVTQPPTYSQARAMVRALQEAGYTIRRQRRRNGKTQLRTFRRMTHGQNTGGTDR